MAYTSSSLHLHKHLLLPKTNPSSSYSRPPPPSFVAAAAKINGVNGHSSKKSPNGKAQINGDGKKGVNGSGRKKAAAQHINGNDRIHLSVSTGGAGGQDGFGLRVAFQGAPGASVESTMEGTALRNYDLLLRHDLVMVQEINLFVHYCLLAMPGVRAAEVRRVISHPMALAHCGRALARLGVDREPVEDTAGAVEMLRSNRMLDTAAIASPRAADLYGLDVLAHGLQDESWNVTRFLLLSKPPSPVTLPMDADAKTSMVVAHRGGSMMVVLKVLSAFSSRNINLTPVMILDTSARGAPTLRAFPHVLYVDCEGASHDPRVLDAIKEIERFAVFVRVLGSYAADSNVYDLQ
uniref:Prephenate dehydratase domain-containing protein n=1 Tax=Oryza barthii TaxID=65489 RepID=A0A0D3HFT8_9ORYZ